MKTLPVDVQLPPPPRRLRKSKYYTNLERLNECIEQYSDTNTSSEQLNQPSCSKQLQESNIHNLQTSIHYDNNNNNNKNNNNVNINNKGIASL